LLLFVGSVRAESGSSQTKKPREPQPRRETEVIAPAGGGASQTAQRVREKKYFYSSFGTRDPFRALVGGEFEPRLQELVDLHTAELVGVLWEDEEHLAIVQDAQGFGYNLRPGDRVRNGSVVSVTEEQLVARLSVFGHTSRVTLRLQREE
jgi:hypothetical protein